MAVGDLRDAAQLARPRDLGEKPVRVRDVRLDLATFLIVEVALADHEETQLVVAQEAALDTIEVDIPAAVDLAQLVEVAKWQHRRLRCADHPGEKTDELTLSLP